MQIKLFGSLNLAKGIAHLPPSPALAAISCAASPSLPIECHHQYLYPAQTQPHHPTDRHQFTHPSCLVSSVYPFRIMPKRSPPSAAAIAIHFHCLILAVSYWFAHFSPRLKDPPFTIGALLRLLYFVMCGHLYIHMPIHKNYIHTI
jgi:hypothetical protein